MWRKRCSNMEGGEKYKRGDFSVHPVEQERKYHSRIGVKDWNR